MSQVLQPWQLLVAVLAGWVNEHQRRSMERPRTMREITELVVQMARENSLWGYSRIQGALENLGHRVGRTTGSSRHLNAGRG